MQQNRERERPGGMVEVQQLAWLPEYGWVSVRLLGTTAHVKGREASGNPRASLKKNICGGTSMTQCKPAQPAHLKALHTYNHL